MKILVLKYGKEYMLGLGDVIDCLSLICQVAKSVNEMIIFPCFGKYEANIQSMLPKGINVKLYPFANFQKLEEMIAMHECIRLENNDDYIATNKITGISDIKGLYHIAGFDYERRNEHCPIALRTWSYKGYMDAPSTGIAFIPEGGSRALNENNPYRIDRKYIKQGLKILTPPQTTMMLQWIKVIEGADEIHCHYTSWPRLIEKLNIKGNLFMHHYVRGARIKPQEWEFTKPWKELL